MIDEHGETAVSAIAAAIGEPARSRMLLCLMDNRARSATELAVVAGVTPSTASVHLSRLKTEGLVKMQVQGKHRYYSLQGPRVARVLESLANLTDANRPAFTPRTPVHLRAARTCYDHIAGALGVQLHDRFIAARWLTSGDQYDLTPKGAEVLASFGMDIAAARAQRRRFAFPCLDWSERRPHLGGALGCAILRLALKRKWVAQELDSRALRVTAAGRRNWTAAFGVEV